MHYATHKPSVTPIDHPKNHLTPSEFKFTWCTKNDKLIFVSIQSWVVWFLGIRFVTIQFKHNFPVKRECAFWMECLIPYKSESMHSLNRLNMNWKTLIARSLWWSKHISVWKIRFGVYTSLYHPPPSSEHRWCLIWGWSGNDFIYDDDRHQADMVYYQQYIWPLSGLCVVFLLRANEFHSSTFRNNCK